jgi:hypothetical protein
MGATHIEAGNSASDTGTGLTAAVRLRLVPVTFAQACAFVEATIATIARPAATSTRPASLPARCS